jgi:endonuclease/exonuclease/phosphatase family metal-dependent hydrolase
MRVRVVTWNVLHRIHAVNWEEGPVAGYPDESIRSAAIAAEVAALAARQHGCTVLLLQEVSGDQLARLRAELPSAEVFQHAYPRIPRLRRADGSHLLDPTEHLVTLIAGATARLVRGETARQDPGKGFLAVALDGGPTVLNTHVSAGERRVAQLEAIANAMDGAAPGCAIVGGDFNADAAIVAEALGARTTLARPPGDRPTRVSTDAKPGRAIDHIAVVRGAIRSAAVLDGRGLSDHHPVAAEVEG